MGASLLRAPGFKKSYFQRDRLRMSRGKYEIGCKKDSPTKQQDKNRKIRNSSDRHSPNLRNEVVLEGRTVAR